MRREYLIDGYNLLWSASPISWKDGPGNLERARNALLSWIARRAQDPSQITIVFDAGPEAPRHGPIHARAFGIHVLFAKDHPDADELIGELCRRCSAPSRMVVVSDDHEVRRFAKRRRAQTMHCQEYVAQLESRRILRTVEPEKPDRANPTEEARWRKVFEIAGGEELPSSEADFLRDMLAGEGDAEK